MRSDARFFQIGVTALRMFREVQPGLGQRKPERSVVFVMCRSRDAQAVFRIAAVSLAGIHV
jgi:hypothetical protein